MRFEALNYAHAVAAVPLAIWVYLLVLRGRFWVPRELTAADGHALAAHGTIVAIVPARDEAATIGQAVRSLLQQATSPPLRVIVIDDGSADGTADVARDAAAAVGAAGRLTVLHGAPLQQGWTGKLWAMSQGVAAAIQFRPDYLLFTDADIEHGPNSVATLVAHARALNLDMASLMVRLSTATWAERCLIPAFVFFFLKLYPPRWIASSRARTAGAAGGCVLVRPAALAKAGGLEAIRTRVIDDCALAGAIKGSGGRIWLGLTRAARSLRVYGSFGEIGAMISRSAFSQLRHSWLGLAGTLVGLGLTYLAPAALLFAHDPVWVGCGALAWAAMTLCYLPMVRFYRLTPLYAVLLPLVALFYAAATVHSAVRYASGRGGQWKGRTQDVRAA